jgi:dTDP-4-dehydrorhamnose 3,5-epimerase
MVNVDKLSGVILTPLKVIEHPLGNVMHGIKFTDDGFAGFEEAYFSTIKYDVIKPWKKHLNMTLNLIVPVGEIKFVIYDDRIESQTNNCFMDVSLSLNNYKRLTVPPGVWVAFKGIGMSLNLLLNASNLLHDPNEIIRKELNEFDIKL